MFSSIYLNQYWATHQQQLLLKACLLDQPQSLNAYNQWIDQVNIDLLDHESNQLLGLLYQNLIKQQIDSKHLGRLKGINRYQWTKNQLIISQFEQIYNQFKEHNIDFLCLDDLAILSHYYENNGSKFIHNLSLLIRPNNLGTIEKILINLGWQIETKPINSRSQFSNLWFKNDKNQGLVCKSSLFIAQPQEYTDNQIWEKAIAQQIGRSHTKILSAIDTFLLLCLQANQKDRLSITKIADIMMLLNKANIDWVELVTKTQRYRLILPVRNMLSFINNILEVTLPEWLLPSLYEMPISDYELLNYRIPALARGLKLKSLFLKTKQIL